MRIADTFVAVTVIILSLTLIASGILISKINSDYLESGIRSAKIVAERESIQILLTKNNSLLLSPEKDYTDIADKILTFLPPPVNTVYLTVKEFMNTADKQ